MKRKIFSILFALVLVLSLGLVTAVPAAAGIINVDDSMTTTQINAAIAGAGSGDTIQFANGTYNLTAPLVVGVDVTLQGDTITPTNVVINTGTIAGVDRDCFQVIVDDVTIQGFKMQNAISQPTVTNWDGWQNAGIMVGNDGGSWGGQLMNRTDGPIRANNGTFSNNIIDNCSIGIYLYESNGHTLSNNTIMNATIENHASAGIGIMLFSEHVSYLCFSSIQILNNIIADSDRLGICTWQEVDYINSDIDLTGVVIDGNELYGNEWAIGLWMVTGTPRISGNDIHDNTHGITSVGSDLGSGHAVNFNNIYNNTSSGIDMDHFGGWPHADTYTMSAENNWWGHASGPSGPDGRVNQAGKSIGKGDAVYGAVDWDPWLPQPIKHTKHDPVPPGLPKRK